MNFISNVKIGLTPGFAEGMIQWANAEGNFAWFSMGKGIQFMRNGTYISVALSAILAIGSLYYSSYILGGGGVISCLLAVRWIQLLQGNISRIKNMLRCNPQQLLLDACERGDYRKVKALVEEGKGCDLHKPGILFSRSGMWTPLMVACSIGKKQLIQFLLQKGAQPNKPTFDLIKDESLRKKMRAFYAAPLYLPLAKAFREFCKRDEEKGGMWSSYYDKHVCMLAFQYADQGSTYSFKEGPL